MSRTEKTAPYHVKRREHYREYHNHIKGYCNLPVSPDVQDDSKLHWVTDCHYDCDWNHPIYRCGCGMCGWPSQSKELRAADKRAVREGVREWLEDQVVS